MLADCAQCFCSSESDVQKSLISLIFFVGKHQAKKPNCMQLAHDVDAKIMFPEVAEIEVVEGHSKTIKELTMVVSFIVFLISVILMTCFFL